MKRFLACGLLLGALFMLRGGTASASDYYVTDDGGYVYDDNSSWTTTAPVDSYGYYDNGYTYVTPDVGYNSWYGPSVGLDINIGRDHDRDYWRHSHFDGDRNYGHRDYGNRDYSNRGTGYQSGNFSNRSAAASSSNTVRSSGHSEAHSAPAARSGGTGGGASHAGRR